MADTIGTAYVQIEPSFDGVVPQIDKEFGGAGESGGKSFTSGFGTAMKGFGVATAAAGAAVASIGTKFVDAAGDVASYGDNIDKMAQKIGISSEAYQEWDAVFQHSGTSIDVLQMGMKTLRSAMDNLGESTGEAVVDQVKLQQAQLTYENKLKDVEKAQLAYNAAVSKSGKDSDAAQKALINLEKAQNNAEIAATKVSKAAEGEKAKLSDAGQALVNLGISAVDANGNLRDEEEVFSEVITALQGMENETERARIASQLLGRGGTELGALLNTSAEETQAMKDRVHELGGVMSDDGVKAAAAFQDQLQDMQTAFSGLSRNMMSQFLPDVTKVMSGLTEIFSGNSDEGLAQISDGIRGIVDGITEALPKIAETGGQILEALATAIIDNLPQLIETGFQILEKLCSYIIENLQTIIEAGLQIILQLALGIAHALPELIPAIVETVMTIVEYLIDNIDLLIDASIAIIVALADGLIEALPKLIEKAPEIIMKLLEALIRNAPKILEAGVMLIFKLIEGIVSAWTKLFQVGKDVVDKFKEGFSDKVEEAKKWGKDLIQNFIDGILDKFEALKGTVKKCAQAVKDFLGFSEPKEGPLSDFHTFAPDMMDLFAEGITENIGTVEQALNDATADVMSSGLNVEAAQDVQMSVNPASMTSSGDRIGRIEALLEDFITNFKQNIYLDTGALVGGTVNAYNTALGQLAVQGANR